MNSFKIALIVTLLAALLLNSPRKVEPVAISQDKPNTEEIKVKAIKPNKSVPKNFKITFDVRSPRDIKIKESDQVSENDLIADQTTERDRLLNQKESIELALRRLDQSIIIKPISPKPVPLIAPVPKESYAEYEAAIDKQQIVIKSLLEKNDLLKRQYDLVKGMDQIDQSIIDHETMKLSDNLRQLEIETAELDLLKGKLETAKNRHSQLVYDHSIALARRQEEENQSQSIFNDRLAKYQSEIRDKDYKMTDLKSKIQNIDDKINLLTSIRSPYTGYVKKIKVVNQSNDRINVVVTIGTGKESNDPGSGSTESILKPF